MNIQIIGSDREENLLSAAIENYRAIFLLDDAGSIAGDAAVCSGALPAELDGAPCEHSVDGRIPAPVALNETDEFYSPDKGKPHDLCPPCALQNLSNLGHWAVGRRRRFPNQLHDLRLFKCRKGFWLVVPGITEERPQMRQSGKSSSLETAAA